MGLFIGLISGTSIDGVDAALVDITDENMTVISSLTFPYPDKLRSNLLGAIDTDYRTTLHEIATLNIEVGNTFAIAANELLNKAGISANAVTAIGSHGQTLRHSPDSSPPYSIQIGDAPTIAARTAINTIENFRGLDIACGGQGAPLVPAFHEWLFRTPEETRVVLNIGGISNITALPNEIDKNIFGYDTGPGNCLMDEWCSIHLGKPFDNNGTWALSGDVSIALLQALQADAYFAAARPKSTGREYFNVRWLQNILNGSSLDKLPPQDVQATLMMLTTKSIIEELEQGAPDCRTLIVCGGGAFNQTLMSALRDNQMNCDVITSAKYGLDPAIVEACAFAWLGYCRHTRRKVKLTTRNVPVELVIGGMHIAP